MTLALQPTGTVRLTIRASAGHFRREMDFSIPTNVSLDEVMGELTDLMDAPTISKPWRASTAAGRTINHAVPLAQTTLADGSLVLLRPHTPPPAPVIRDAAESLAAAEAHLDNQAAITAWSLIGVALAATVLSFFTGWPLALAGAGVLSLGLALGSHITGRSVETGPKNSHGRQTAAFASSTLTTGALSAAGFVADLQLGLFAASAALTFIGLLLHITALATARLKGTAATLAILCALAATGAYLPGLQPPPATGPTLPPALEVLSAHTHLAIAAVTIAAALILITAAPAVTTRLAGLSIPQLPTAGEDLGVSDIDYTAIESQTRRARHLYEGCLLGSAIATTPAFAVLALFPGATGYLQALCVTALVACLLHASRQVTALGMWALLAITAQAATAASVLAGLHPHWATISTAAIIIAAMTTSTLWHKFLRNLEPTTMVWIERAEALAVVAIIPLCMHLSGVFVWIRALG
ncbi:type VII secretion integral membrane protein EccD [Corynebacterium phocae]|uniref:type VII secretion integral membrane protein EccD n=1 Tax=Corynebacterium phocae TaxID=161895 RepID=UPI000950FD93|nr:type VII secretion integral membrane protein EccD [Corynebacterium phocae]KAA8721948.1 type VII secretion integral membrane protein EccD [Corynebacterium phocae]